MTTQDILSHRFTNQKLCKTNLTSPADVVKWFGAMQAQDYIGAKWGIGQRLHDITDAIIEKAFNDGEILRTHVMRPTWHFVHQSDIRWMLELTGPRVIRIMASYNKLLELNEDVFSLSQKAIVKILHGKKALTRQEIKQELERIGIITNTQRLAHIVCQAELEKVICSGPMRGKQCTHMLLEERVPKVKSVDRDTALAELTKRYFQSHGPATIKDFSWWSGLTISDVKKGIHLLKPDIINEVVDGKIYWFYPVKPLPIPDKVFLLSNYDEYGIAYTERESFFSPEYNNLLNARGNATFQHLIMHKGLIIGTWKRIIKKGSIDIAVEFFSKKSSLDSRALQKACEQYGRFLGLNVEPLSNLS